LKTSKNLIVLLRENLSKTFLMHVYVLNTMHINGNLTRELRVC